MTRPSVSIVIIHYSSRKNVKECLLSLKKVRYDGQLNILLVDNAAKESITDLKNILPNTEIIRLEHNTGFTGGNNVGMRRALEQKSDFVVLLNDDTTVDPDFIEALVQGMERHPQAGATVAKIYFSPGREFHTQSYDEDERGQVIWYAGGNLDWKEVVAWHRGVDEVDHGQFNDEQKTPFATGCCVLLRSKALQEVGLFDEAYFLYWEDVDLSLRLQHAGWETWFVPQAKIWHKNAGSSGAGSPLHEYYQTRNRYRLGWRFAPLRTKVFLARHAWRQLRTGSPAVQRAILDSLQGSYGKRQDYHT